MQVGDEQIAAHKFILASRSDFFSKCFAQPDAASSDPAEPVVIDTKQTNVKLFKQLLTFIYSDSCDLLTPKLRVDGTDMCLSVERTVRSENPPPANSTVDVIDGQSAHEVFKQNKKKAAKGKSDSRDTTKLVKQTLNPVESLTELASRFEVNSLSQRLENIKLKGTSTSSFYRYFITISCSD